MDWAWTLAGLLLALAALGQALLTLLQTYEHRRFARSRLRHVSEHPVKGRVALIVPCRGSDEGLEANLAALRTQDYGNYEVRFVVESPEDPAHALIADLLARSPRVSGKVVVAGQATTSGQKVHNLRAATADLPEDIEYLAFADSDARPASHWLRALVSRLDAPGVGAESGYRWFVPARPSLANHLLYSINGTYTVFLGHKAPNFVWGGSWAIRRDVFQRLRVREAWEGTLSDDLVVTRVLRQAGLRVEFEPACMVASPLDTTLAGLVEFVRRQYTIVRHYARPWWMLAVLLSSLAVAAFWGSLGAVVVGLAGGRMPWLAAFTLAALYVLGVYRGRIRRGAALAYFPHLRQPLDRAAAFDTWAFPLAGLANWLILAASAVGSTIAWRGITYRLRRDGRVESQHRGPKSAAGVRPGSHRRAA